MRVLPGLIFTVIASLFACNAFAQGARAHFRSGQDYYTQGRYEKAIEEFEEAYQLDPKPLLLFNIAQSHEKLGNLPKAIEYLKRYLKDDPNTDQKASLENKIRVLEERVASTGIKVKCNVEGATIYVDEASMGTTPFDKTMPLPVGTHKIRVAKDGYSDFKMGVAISAGHSVTVEANLEPLPKETVSATPATEQAVEEKTEVEEKKKIEVLDVVPWAIAGVGAAAAIAGLAVMGAVAQSKDDHGLAVAADAVGWPGVALAVGGTIWGIIRVVKGKSSKSESAELDETALLVVPIIDDSRFGVAAALTF